MARESVRTYWLIGQRIAKANATTKLGYHDTLLKLLSDDLDVDVRTLQRSLVFFETYKDAPSKLHLSWSHYRELIKLPSADERAYYEALASEQDFTRNQLVDAIRDEKFLENSHPTRAKAKKLERPKQATYVYAATVQRVIDADTLLLLIDLGFLVHREQRVRLVGVDTEPSDTAEGRNALGYVHRQLAKAKVLLVKTHQIDIYGRYLGHLFYTTQSMPKPEVFERGRYLNQELLDRGLAAPT